jgi:uncharacterized protein
MGGAMAPMLLAWRIARARAAPICGGSFPATPAGGFDGKLLGGAALFGAGWGLVGFCPGPALAALGSGSVWALYFSMAMLIGMGAHAILFPSSKMADVAG